MPYNGSARQGLSPRVRRHLWMGAYDVRAVGSISACAEASARRNQGRNWAEVYLRVCGGIFRRLFA